MKTALRIIITASFFSMVAAPQVFAAGVEELENAGGAPAHMLFYEAAEQAAEEKYAVIVPSTDSKQEKKDVDAKAEQPKDDAADVKAEEEAPKKAK